MFNCQKTVQFTIILNWIKQQILPFKNLEPENSLHICFDLNNNVIIKNGQFLLHINSFNKLYLG